MTPATSLLVADALLSAGLKIWAAVEGRPAGWTPSPDDWQRLRAANGVAASDFERQPQLFPSAPVSEPDRPLAP